MQINRLEDGVSQVQDTYISLQKTGIAQAEIPTYPRTSESSSAPHSLDDLFYTIITEVLEDRIAWSVRRTEAWIIVSRESVVLPEQGWKLHVSAGLSSAEAVLSRILPVLCDAQVCFKVASSLRQLRSLNHGLAGNSQVGKFITIYPVDEVQAVQLAVALDNATRGLRGPLVSSDRPLYKGSLVSYRYGSYRNKLMYTSSGSVTSVLTTPTGDLVADLRQRGRSVPDWVQDPFLAAHVAQGEEKSSLSLIAGRYLQLSSLYESPRGGIASGVDVLQGRPCVLKYARQDTYLDFDGKDACDALRYEASILASLAPDTSFPVLFDLIEQENTLYMIMEEIQGETLGAYAEHAFAQAYLPVELVVQWGKELASVLGKLHEKGLIYRDLKPTNILVTAEKKLRLIDFELVLAQGYQHAKNDIGTRGFMSPQHRAGGPASIADDIYSLGALLFYLVTRASPTHAPDPANLLQRPLKLLNPALGEEIVQLITTCLEPDPALRFSSMEAVDTALAALGTELLLTQPPLGAEHFPEARETTPVHYLELARQLGETLCQTTVRQHERPGVTWLSKLQFAEGMPLRAIHTGVAGTLLALAELVAVMDDPSLRATLQEGVQWLLHSEGLIARPIPGLYTGEAGVGAALLRSSQVLQEPDLLVAACEKSHWIARQPYTSQDIMNGAAGRLRFHLLLWDETRETEHLQAALDAGNWLSEVAEDAGAGALCWTLPVEFTGLAYAGYAHGAAGIADALLDLFEVTQDERFLRPVMGAYRLLDRLAVPVLQDHSGLNWPLYACDKKSEMAGIYWCHGSSGIGKFLLHVSELKLMPGAMELTRRAAWTVARGSRWAGPTQCHGLAGNIEFLLDMFQGTGQQACYAEARTLARLLETFATRQDEHLVWLSDSPSLSPDYLLGYAGVLSCLLRLANPAHQPHQLSRRGFRYRPVV
ncbi:MAG TPA: class IV lanthionine synthetase LanL [Ktedonobacteraceae bacterium]|nr:class IV lanthionine synthetase LanL [Ktedonobacteraceae bacterium]